MKSRIADNRDYEPRPLTPGAIESLRQGHWCRSVLGADDSFMTPGGPCVFIGESQIIHIREAVAVTKQLRKIQRDKDAAYRREQEQSELQPRLHWEQSPAGEIHTLRRAFEEYKKLNPGAGRRGASNRPKGESMKEKASPVSEIADLSFQLLHVDGRDITAARQLDSLISSYFGDSVVKSIIAYYRVSTAKQGRSGLGLEGQQAAVESFVAQRGCQLLASYQEVESGKKSDRPQLAKALAHARRSKATLVVAKLDRLARNVAFLSRLMESSVDFIAIDLEHANRLTIHILSAVAEGEAKAISDRTKAALQAAKARGTKLGSARPGHWEGREDSRAAGLLKARKAAAVKISTTAREAYADLLPEIQQMRAGGATLQQIADSLNAQGHTTRRGARWNANTAKRVIDRIQDPG